jgi:hypothetical protein
MARRYNASGSDTNTAATTMWGVTSATTIRPAIYEVLIGSVATPADNAWEFILGRFTAAGTSTAFTPVALDPSDPAALAAAGFNHTVEPTYTANAYLLRIAGNMRAAVRWIAAPGGELKMPATAANGIGCLSNAVGGSAVAMSFTIHWEE